MKLLGLIFLFLFIQIEVIKSQNISFNAKLNEMSDSLSVHLGKLEKKKIAVWNFTDTDGETINIGKYISEDVSVNLSTRQNSDNYEVIDRQHLAIVFKELEMKKLGIFDGSTIKEVGQMIQADAIVTGTVFVLPKSIKLTMKVIDVETAKIIAAVSDILPLDEDARELLGIPLNNETNRGFNRPLLTGEQYNNPKLVAEDCSVEKYGDYCLINSANRNLKVAVNTVNRFPSAVEPVAQFATLKPGQTNCFYHLKEGVWYYRAANPDTWGYDSYGQAIYGQFVVEKCKSKSLSLK